MTGRYGFTNRFELEAKVPYVYINGDTVSREIFTGTAVDNVFNADGNGLGDVEATARYQLNLGGPDKAFYIGWLRYKSRTGKDLFEVVTDCVTRCVANTTGTGLPLELPTGTGFESLQTGRDLAVSIGPGRLLRQLQLPLQLRARQRLANAGAERRAASSSGRRQGWRHLGLNFGLGLALNEQAVDQHRL